MGRYCLMGEYEDKTIIDVLEKVNDEYFLPHIQRPFVWKEDQILKLFDSLLRGYPIGSFLFWTTPSSEVRRRKFLQSFYKKYADDFNVEKLGLEDNDKTKKTITLVLDGQQRLQSLFIALKGKYEDKELYFDLLSGQEEDEDGFLFCFDFFKSPPKDDEESLWIRANNLLSKIKKLKSFTSVTDNILECDKRQARLRNIVSENVERFYRSMLSEKKITYYPVTEEEPEQVFDIFVRVNSGGTKLSKSDLLFSFIKLKWSKYAADKAIPEFLDKLNGNDQFDFDVDMILKTSIVLLGQPVKYTIKTFTGEKGKKTAEDIEGNWKEICDSIACTIDLIRDEFKIVDKKLLSSNNALIPIIYYAYINGYKASDDFKEGDKKRMRSWLLNALLAGSFSGHSDAAIERVRKAIDRFSDDGFPSKKINQSLKELKQSTEINAEIINDIFYRMPESYLLLYLVYPYSLTFRTSSDANYPEQDHIFSRKELERKYAATDINSIGNLRFITSHANKRKLDSPYSEWSRKESPAELRLSLIPGEAKQWNVNNFEEFLRARKKLILQKVIEALS